MSKKSQRNLMLCFRSADEAALQIALRYWHRDNNGWSESPKLLAKECGLQQNEFSRHLKNLAIAYDLNTRCEECGLPAEVSSRSAYARHYEHGSLAYFAGDLRLLLCRSCANKAAEYAQQATQKAEQYKRDMINDIITNWLSESEIDLENLEVLDTLYLYAVLLGANELDDSDGFDPWLDFNIPVAASPNATTEIFLHLFRKRIVIPSRKSALSSFNFDQSAVVSFNPNKVKWQLSLSLCAYPFETLLNALSIMIDTHVANAPPEAVKALWQLVAMSECESKLQECADYYGFKNLKIGDKTRHALAHALEKFSIPQVWSVIYSATKNSAAFGQSQASKGKQHAVNAIPGNIIRFVDYATLKNWTVNARTRQHWMAEPTLTSLFFNRVLAGYPDGFRTITSAIIREICHARSLFPGANVELLE